MAGRRRKQDKRRTATKMKTATLSQVMRACSIVARNGIHPETLLTRVNRLHAGYPSVDQLSDAVEEVRKLALN